MNSQLILQILAASGLAGILGAVVNGIINRRKLGAEATQIITSAAGGMVERLQAEVTRKDSEMDEMRKDILALRRKVDSNEQDMAKLRETLQIHALWDYKALQLIKELHPERAISLGEPPALMFDRRHDEV